MQEDLKDPRFRLLDNIDYSKCRVEFSSTPIVLLCGGTVAALKNSPEDSDPPIASLRDAISRRFPKFELFMPEKIKSWQADGIFKNLMEFEADLASICSLVVIVLESAGSLAELGAFSQLPDLSKKIIAIRSNNFKDKDDDSFINLGILRYISENHRSSIKNYPWNIHNPKSIDSVIIDDVILDIEKELSNKKSENLSLSKSSHIIVLICEIIYFFIALKEHEIYDYLTCIGVCNLSKDNLRKKLFLLKEFNLINKEEYSDSTFYMRSEEPYNKLRLTSKSGHKTALTIKMECMDYYRKSGDKNEKNHQHRLKAIKAANSGINK